jgi:hypothetical protein
VSDAEIARGFSEVPPASRPNVSTRASVKIHERQGELPPKAEQFYPGQPLTPNVFNNPDNARQYEVLERKAQAARNLTRLG